MPGQPWRALSQPLRWLPFPTAVLTKSHGLAGLKQTWILSQFWRLEAQSGDVMATPPLQAPGENPSLTLLASGGYWPLSAFLGLGLHHPSPRMALPLCVPPFMWSSVCTSVS